MRFESNAVTNRGLGVKPSAAFGLHRSVALALALEDLLRLAGCLLDPTPVGNPEKKGYKTTLNPSTRLGLQM